VWFVWQNHSTDISPQLDFRSSSICYSPVGLDRRAVRDSLRYRPCRATAQQASLSILYLWITSFTTHHRMIRMKFKLTTLMELVLTVHCINKFTTFNYTDLPYTTFLRLTPHETSWHLTKTVFSFSAFSCPLSRRLLLCIVFNSGVSLMMSTKTSHQQNFSTLC